MNIIKMETKRAREEKERKRREQEHRQRNRLKYSFCIYQFKEILSLIEDDYDRDDIDRWGFEKITLDFWHNVEISNYDYDYPVDTDEDD